MPTILYWRHLLENLAGSVRDLEEAGSPAWTHSGNTDEQVIALLSDGRKRGNAFSLSLSASCSNLFP